MGISGTWVRSQSAQYEARWQGGEAVHFQALRGFKCAMGDVGGRNRRGAEVGESCRVLGKVDVAMGDLPVPEGRPMLAVGFIPRERPPQMLVASATAEPEREGGS